MVEIVYGIDVSSAQDRDLTNLIQAQHPQHVVVKLYQSFETVSQDYSRAQIQSALDNHCTVGGYVWLYGGIDPAQQVRGAIELAQSCGITLPILWIDCETYTEKDGSATFPSLADAEAAAQECYRLGIRPGIYTGNWFIEGYWGKQIGVLIDLAVWLADYNSPADLSTFSPYWPAALVMGHQYSDKPVDLDVFDREVTMQISPPPVPGPDGLPPPSYEQLQTIIGYLTHDIPDALESEANRKPRCRPEQVRAIAQLCRDNAL